MHVLFFCLPGKVSEEYDATFEGRFYRDAKMGAEEMKQNDRIEQDAKQTAFALFEQTGSINYYLFYRELNKTE